MPVAQSRPPDLPGYCALTFPLMPVGSTSRRSVQELGFASMGLLTPPCRLYPLPVRQASVLPTASSRFRLATDTFAVRLTLPLAGCVEDFHLQVSAPCRAHQEKGVRKTAPLILLSNSEELEVDLRAEQNVGGVSVAAAAEGVAAVGRDIRADPAHRAAEGHARAVGVNNTGSPARRIQAAVADTAGEGNVAQAFVVVQVGEAQLERAGRPVDAGHPGAVQAVMLQTAVVAGVQSADAELLPGEGSADVPLFEGVVLVESPDARVLNVRVTAAQRNAGFLPLAFIPQRTFPGIAVGAGPVLRRNGKGVRGVSTGHTAGLQNPVDAGRIGRARLEAAEHGRQVGDLVVVARGIVGIVQLAGVEEAARTAAGTSAKQMSWGGAGTARADSQNVTTKRAEPTNEDVFRVDVLAQAVIVRVGRR